MSEFEHYSEEARQAVLRIRSLEDVTLVLLADGNSALIAQIMTLTGRDTNPNWVTSQAAEEAYSRRLIDEVTLDRLTS